MAPRYRSKKPKYKKRKYRSKSKSGLMGLTGSGTVASQPLPKKFLYKTRYCEPIVTLDPGAAGVPAHFVFNASSLFDPNFTGTGHQPLGFDQLMPLYDHYTVIGARIRASCSNTDGGSPQTVCLSLRDNTTTTTDIGRVIENGMCRWAVLGESVGGGNTKTLSLNFSANKFFGHSVMDGDKYKGTISSSPAESAYFHLTVAPLEGVDAASVRANVTIEYIAMLTEPKMLTVS